MNAKHFDYLPAPRLVTLRKLDGCENHLRKAMKFYNTRVASSVFIKSMIDAPLLAEDLDNLRHKYRKLLKEHEELKETIKEYFLTEKKLEKLVGQ